MEIILGLLPSEHSANPVAMYPLTASRSGAGSRIGLYKVFSLGMVFPFLGALLAVPAGNSLFEIYANNPADTLGLCSSELYGEWGD